MFSLKKLPTFNELHKEIIESVIKVHLDEIIQTFIAAPEKALQAFNAMLSGIQEKEVADLSEVSDSIEAVRYILMHDAPENLLKLNKRVTKGFIAKSDVVEYIKQRISDISKQFANLDELMPFIQRKKEAIQVLLKSCDALTIAQFPQIGKIGLKILIEHPKQISILLDKVSIPVQLFLAFKKTIRNELIEHALDLANFKVASISWQEIIALPPVIRVLFYKQASIIVNLIQNKKTTFDELKAHADTLEEFIEEKKNAQVMPETPPSSPRFILPYRTQQSDSSLSSSGEDSVDDSENDLDDLFDGLYADRYLINHQSLPSSTESIEILVEGFSHAENQFLFHSNRPIETSVLVDKPRGMGWIENKSAIQLPDDYIALGNDEGGTGVIIKPDSGQVVKVFNNEGHRLPNLTLLQNGMVAGCDDNAIDIYIYDLNTSELVRTIPHNCNVNHLFSMDRYLIAFAKNRNPTYIYDVYTGELVNFIPIMHDNSELLVAENTILLLGRDTRSRKYCQWINPLTSEILREERLKDNPIGKAILLPCGRMAVSDYDSKIYIYNLETCIGSGNFFSHKFKLATYTNVIHSLALSANGHLLVGDNAGRVQEYNYKTGESLHAFKCRNTRCISTPLALKMLFNRLTGIVPEEAPRVMINPTPLCRRHSQ